MSAPASTADEPTTSTTTTTTTTTPGVAAAATTATTPSNSQSVKLVSKQTGWSQDVLQSHLSMSTYISTSLAAEPTRAVLVVDLSTPALQSIIKYCEYHRGTEPRLIEPPLRSRRMHEVCEYVWDGEFIDDIATQSLDLLFDVAVGALYLQIQSLVHLACAKIASMIKSHPLDKVKSILLGHQLAATTTTATAGTTTTAAAAAGQTSTANPTTTPAAVAAAQPTEKAK